MAEHPLDILDSPVRRRIVDLLANRGRDVTGRPGGMTAAELGHGLGLHATTARFHLDQLEVAGLVASSFERRGVGRPRKVYRTPERPLPTRTDPGEALARLTALLTEAWDRPADVPPLTPEEAGRRWAHRHAGGEHGQAPATTPGAWLGKVGATLDLLHRWGYLPELRTEDGGRTAELTLLDCPFLELARAHPDVVCAVHRGLLRGALEAVGEDDVEVGLQPLVTPRRCRATVTTRTPFEPPTLT